MRRTLIFSALAASALTVGLAATVAQAGGGRDPAVTPTTVPAIPELEDLSNLGITPEQSQCLIDNATATDTSDLNALLALMTQCGIDPMDIAGGLDPSVEPLDPAVITESTKPGESVGTEQVDPVSVASVLAGLGLDQIDLQCIEDGLTTAVPGDDNAALTMLQGCGLTLSGLLAGLAGLDDTVGAVDVPTVPSVGSPTTVGIAAGSQGAIVEQIQQMLIDQYGIELTDEQVNCLVDNLGSLDMNDMNTTVAVFESCGISLTDLAP